MEFDYDNDTTTSFFTLDGCNGELGIRIMQVLAKKIEDVNISWEEMIEEFPELKSRLISQGIEEPKYRDSITWDAAVILFTCTLEVNSQHKPIQLGEQLSKERFGRFPWGNGSAINYLIEFLRPNNANSNNITRFDGMMNLLKKLSSFCLDPPLGGDKYANGLGGLKICGLLDKSEVHQLRKDMSGRMWSVSADEPLDGGVRDAIKHLILILKAAERRDVGVMLRSHD